MQRVILFLLLFLPYFGKTQTIIINTSKAKSIEVNKTNGPIQLDGKLDETSWNVSNVASDFIQIEPNQGENSKFKTIVKVLSDPSNLYIGVVCYDTVGKNHYKTPDLKRDFAFRLFDMFAIGIDGFHDKRNSMTFATNSYGVQKDYLSFDDLLFDSDWNGLWSVRTTRADSAWIAEFQIPWKTLRYTQKDSTQIWGINFLRLRRNSNEIATWSPYPRVYGFNRMEFAGELAGVQPPKPTTNLQINPYFLFSRQKNREGQLENIPKIGGEMKWAINQNAVLDVTFNTDFAQTDADIQINNLSRFSAFFPEKRQFFLENASFFGANLEPSPADNAGGDMVIQPFFSRRIGLDNLGNPIPIDVGARFVNRSIKQSFGGVVIKQRESESTPNTYFGVGRYSRNLGEQNRIGGMITIKSQDDFDTQKGYSNMVGMVDGFFRLSSAKSLYFMAIPSTNSNGTGKGLSSFVQFIQNTNKLKFWWTESIVTKDFSPETGFVSRKDVIASNIGAFFYIRSKKLPRQLRAYEPGILTGIYHQFSTQKMIERNISIIPVDLNFQSGGIFQLSINNSYQNLTESFKPLGVNIGIGEYNYTRFTATLGSNASEKISYRLKYETGDFFDGKLHTTDLQIVLVPIPNIALKLRYLDNKFNEVGTSKSNERISLINIESRFALNPRVQLTALYQYNSNSNFNAYNVRFSWEYKPLSFIYLIWNNRVFDQMESNITNRIIDNAVFAKISLLKQF